MTRRAFIKAAVIAIAATIAGNQDDDDDNERGPRETGGRFVSGLCRYITTIDTGYCRYILGTKINPTGEGTPR